MNIPDIFYLNVLLDNLCMDLLSGAVDNRLIWMNGKNWNITLTIILMNISGSKSINQVFTIWVKFIDNVIDIGAFWHL